MGINSVVGQLYFRNKNRIRDQIVSEGGYRVANQKKGIKRHSSYKINGSSRDIMYNMTCILTLLYAMYESC